MMNIVEVFCGDCELRHNVRYDGDGWCAAECPGGSWKEYPNPE